MKKVKFMLFGVLVVAAVGGALAFKAKNFSPGLKCGFAIDSCPTVETSVEEDYTFTNVNPIPNYFCTTAGGQSTDCAPVTLE
jgi:hypothetical protein